MKTLKLTAKDFKKSDSYWKDYIGAESVADYDGHIEIEANLGWVRFDSIAAKGHVFAEAGTGIKAGWGIKAGEGIKAGWGIEAGLTITCKLTLKFAYKIFAGICYWRKDLTDDDKMITCGKLEGGEVAYGIVKEIGLPDEKPVAKDRQIEIDGKKYKLVEVE